MAYNHDEPTKAQIQDFLRQHGGWKLLDNKLQAEFKFADFKQAFAFMSQVAEAAEKLNHHPNWSNAYNRVSFELWTHETGGVSQHDLDLAQIISQLATNYSA